MTIKDVAAATGLTHQAIYKRLKNAGLKVAELKNNETGEFTEEGERKIRALFNLGDVQFDNRQQQVDNLVAEVTELRNQVEKLTTEAEDLRNQIDELTKERDFLRTSLSNEQQLHAMTLAKFALPAPAEPKRRSLWDRLRGRGDSDGKKDQ